MAIYISQLLGGKDFATNDSFAMNMANFIYLIGDEQSRECLVVDPAWDVQGILNYIDNAGLTLTGALVTHYHPDHIGGKIWGYEIEGLADLMALRPVPVHVNKHEREGVQMVSGLSTSDFIEHEGGDEVEVGQVRVRLLHTPGHTPGSQCFMVGSNLVSGDTLFIGGCGRVDLPGGDATQLYYSLTQVLAALPDETILYPGHNYASKPSSTMGFEKSHNTYLKIKGLEDWLGLMGQ